MSDAEDVLRRITEAIEEAKGCFDAAVTEGLYERLRENEFAESGSIRGLVERRMIYAYKPIEEAIALARILEAQIEGYKRALQFYADPLNYKYVRKHDDTRIGYDEGKIAQDALGASYC